MEDRFEERAVHGHGLEQPLEVLHGLVAADGVLENEGVDARGDGTVHALDALGVGRTGEFGELLRQGFQSHRAFLRRSLEPLRERVEIELGRRHAEVPVHGHLGGRGAGVAAQTQSAPDGLLVRGHVEQGVHEVHALQRARIEPLVEGPGRDEDLGVFAGIVLAVPEGGGVRLQDFRVEGLLGAARSRHRAGAVHDEPRGFGRETGPLLRLYLTRFRVLNFRVIFAPDGRVPHLFEERDDHFVGRRVADVHVLLPGHFHGVVQRGAKLVADQAKLPATDVHHAQHAAGPLGRLHLVEFGFGVQARERGLRETVARRFLFGHESELLRRAFRLGIIQVLCGQFPDGLEVAHEILVGHGDVDIPDGLDAVPGRIAADVGVAHQPAEFVRVRLDVPFGQDGHGQRAHEVQDVEDVVHAVAGSRRQREDHDAFAVLFLHEFLDEVFRGAREFGVGREQALHFVHDEHAADFPAPFLGRVPRRFARLACLLTVLSHEQRGPGGEFGVLAGDVYSRRFGYAEFAGKSRERERLHAIL